eukprot:2601869-Prymnesium_polylepis.1
MVVNTTALPVKCQQLSTDCGHASWHRPAGSLHMPLARAARFRVDPRSVKIFMLSNCGGVAQWCGRVARSSM